MMTFSIAIIIFTCLISVTSFNRYDRIDDLSMWPYMVKEKHQYYRFITSGFVHADYMHLIFNMLTLYFFGSFIEQLFQMLFGSKLYFILFYLLALIVSDIPSFIKNRNNYQYRAIGASGAVSAMVFTAILFSPWNKIYVFFFPLPAIVYGVLFLVYSAYMSKKGGDGINHDAHFWGAVFGVAFPLILRPQLWDHFLQQLMGGFRF